MRCLITVVLGVLFQTRLRLSAFGPTDTAPDGRPRGWGCGMACLK